MKTISKIKAVGIDLDGVVYFGDKAAPGAIRAIDYFRRNGLRIFFITNNSVKTRGQIAEKLLKVEICAPVDDIFTAGYATALFLAAHKRANTKILVIGSKGLKSEIRGSGLTLVDKGPCDFLVVGYDPLFTYKKISLGLDALSKGAKFVACNLVSNFPVESGRILPGCGAMVGAIQAASGRRPDLIVGKPNTFLLKLVMSRAECKKEEVLVIGDSAEEDIEMANKFGMPSALISGKLSKKRIVGIRKPTFTAASLRDVVEKMRRPHGVQYESL